MSDLVAEVVEGEAPALPAPSYRVRSRRQWTIAEKLSIVGEISETGDPVAEVARRHGMNANQLFAWRGLVRSGALVASAAPARSSRDPARPDFIELGVVGVPPARTEERIEVSLPSGVVVRVPASAAGKPLRSALASIRAAGL
jgi:transposase